MADEFRQVQFYDFDARDGRGRAIGCQIVIETEWPQRGGGILFSPHGTRDGVRWGPLLVRARRRFATVAEAEVYAATYVEAARERAQRRG